MKLSGLFSALLCLSASAAMAQKPAPLKLTALDHESPESLADYSLKKAADSLKINGKPAIVYLSNYPKIVLKLAEGPVVFEVPYDEDNQKPGEGLRRTIKLEKKQVNKEGTPELIIHWECCINNSVCYKGVKIIDVDHFECILDQVTSKTIEIPADTANNADARPQKIDYRRIVKINPGEIILEDAVAFKPDDYEEDDSDELMEMPSGSYQLTSKNKFVWNKLEEKPASPSLSSKKPNKQNKKEEL